MKFRKKPVEVEAARWVSHDPQPVIELIGDNSGITFNFTDGAKVMIPTLEGTMELTEGNWLVKGVQGELYPVREDIFTATYEKVCDD